MSDDDLTMAQDSDSEGVKSLRAALAKEKAERAAERAKLDELAARDRTRTIADKLRERGVKPGIAEFVGSDVDVDKLDEWLATKADIFGITLDPEPDANAGEAASQERIVQLSSGGDHTEENPDIKKLMEAQSTEDLDRLLFQAQAGKL
jgi:hypothetical protein